MTDLTSYLHYAAELTEATLAEVLPPESDYPTSIHSVMRYSTFAGGKRIRPCLVLASHEACGGHSNDKTVALTCAAIEMLHTFSLIHDDLPCMDDDDFRRGRPTAHRAFSEAIAVLGGDALCIHAFEILTRTGRLDVIAEIAGALGTRGMIGGQVVDIESEGKLVDLATVEYIHNNKTMALILACVRCGALLAGAPPQLLESLSVYGRKIGLAFQVVDDILDEEGTTEQLGKDAGSDLAKGKATFPAVAGMAESKRYASQLIEDACDALRPLGDNAAMLIEIARFIGTRLK
jgi:geranylgeranyl diphosphate synthase type II